MEDSPESRLDENPGSPSFQGSGVWSQVKLTSGLVNPKINVFMLLAQAVVFPWAYALAKSSLGCLPNHRQKYSQVRGDGRNIPRLLSPFPPSPRLRELLPLVQLSQAQAQTSPTLQNRLRLWSGVAWAEPGNLSGSRAWGVHFSPEGPLWARKAEEVHRSAQTDCRKWALVQSH